MGLVMSEQSHIRKSKGIKPVWNIVAVSLAAGLLGCGRYGAPLAPEQFSPGTVRNLVANIEPSGAPMSNDKVSLKLVWDAPLVDARGVELSELYGFRVLKLAIKEADLISGKAELNQADFLQVAEIKSGYTEERDALRKAARQKGEIGRGLNVDDAKLHHEFVDKQIGQGWLYLYKVMPLNQGGVEGGVSQVVRVRRSTGGTAKAPEVIILSANEAGVGSASNPQ
jgi:hypothetical protein